MGSTDKKGTPKFERDYRNEQDREKSAKNRFWVSRSRAKKLWIQWQYEGYNSLAEVLADSRPYSEFQGIIQSPSNLVKKVRQGRRWVLVPEISGSDLVPATEVVKRVMSVLTAAEQLPDERIAARVAAWEAAEQARDDPPVTWQDIEEWRRGWGIRDRFRRRKRGRKT